MSYNAYSKFDHFDPDTELEKINLVSNAESFSEQLDFYFGKLTVQKDLLSRIAININQSLADLIDSKPKTIPSEIFYTIILQIMDFHLGLEFQLDHAIEFLQNSGQNILTDQSVDSNNLSKFIFNALNLRSANGLSLIDNLANDGFIGIHKKTIIFAGKSLPMFDQFIKENYFVDTKIDTDGDGFSDRVLVKVTRPKTDEKVPVILCANPYCQGTNEMDNDLNPIKGDIALKKDFNYQEAPITEYPTMPERIIEDGVDQPTKSSSNQESSDFPLNTYFLARGFAVAYVAGLGTRGSDGMRTTGDRAETITYCRAITFLSGNEAGYYTKTGEKKVTLPWTNGSVGMTGRSYLGTLATAAATQNPVGLKTIISESAISNWYDYYRENGLVVAPGGFPGEDADVLALDTYSRWFDGDQYLKTNQQFRQFMAKMKKDQDRETGNYTQFWQDRNYLTEADQIKIDCLYAHGLNDWNVKPINVYNIFHKANNAKVKVILHQGEHISPHDIQSVDYFDLCNLWLTDHLYDMPNKNLDTLPNIMVQDNRNPDLWSNQDTWGSEEVKTVQLGSGKFTYTDDLTQIYHENFNKNLAEYESSFIQKDDVFNEKCFTLDLKLKDNLTIDGQVEVNVNIATNKKTGLLSAALYEINPKVSKTTTNIVNNRFFQLFADRTYLPLKTFNQEKCAYRLITFGHLNLQNIKGPGTVNQINENEPLNVKLKMQPTIYKLESNSNLRLILFGSDMKYTTQVVTPQNYEINLDESEIKIPFN